MHELSLTKNVLEIVLRYARDNDAKEVAVVELDIGEVRDVVEDLMQKCFTYIAKDTIAAHARLNINFIPLTCMCNQCANIWPFSLKEGTPICPKCGSPNATPYTGQEFLIKNIQIA